jgi:DHA2 family multidrug resistance protein
MSAAATPFDAPRQSMNPWVIAPLVAMAAFMEVLDTTIANVALPHIAGSLATTIDQSTWVLTSYLVANAIVLPLNGFFSAAFGRKRYFMACMALFTVSSLLCGLAPNFGVLIMCRILQGLGGGGLQPGAQAILRDIFPPEKIGTAMATYGIVVVVAPVLGPLLGGFITDNFTWRWCFLINVPIGIVTLFFLSLLLHDNPSHRRIKLSETQIDYIGLGLLAIGLASLQIMLDRGEDADWFASPLIRLLAVTAVVGLIAAFWWEWRHKHPIVNFRMLEAKNFGFATLGMFMFGSILYGSTTLLPLLVQRLFGYDARQAGMVLAPGGIVVFCLMPLVGFLIPRVATRWLISFGVFWNVVALYMMSRLSLHADFTSLAMCRVVQGLGLGFLFVPFNTAAFAFVPKQKLADASGIINLARNIGGSVGISLSVSFVKQVSQVHQNYLVGAITNTNPAYRFNLHTLTQAFAHGGMAISAASRAAQADIYNLVGREAHMLAYVDAFRVLAIVFLFVLPIAAVLKTPSFKSAPVVVE